MIVSLTTIPSRSKFLDPVIQSVLSQTFLPEKIILNVAEKYIRFPEQTVTLSPFVLDNVEVNYCKDYGPLTKILPSLLDYDDFIVCIDDDCILNDEVLWIYDKHLELAETNALGLRGRIRIGNSYNAWSLVTCNNLKSPRSVDLITNVWSGLYSNRIVDKDILLKEYTNCFMNDDILLSSLIPNKKIIPMNGINVPSSVHSVDSLWDLNIGLQNDSLIKTFFK